MRIEGDPATVEKWLQAARARKMNLRRIDAGTLGVALDETTSAAEVDALLAVFSDGRTPPKCEELAAKAPRGVAGFERTSRYLTHPVFNLHHSETEMLRYLRTLESRDVSLVHSMIPLGSCTMKLNATAEMMPITWARFSRIHPFAPVEQAQGYQIVIKQLEAMLSEITGFPAVSLQPNSGAQGELAGLLVIRKHHESRGESHRDVCLIPASAHGTNPASATMAGMRVVVVACDEKGYVELGDLEAKAKEHARELAALMVTYPSTYGIFEEEIERICAIVHEHGGQVYLDGANLNAQVGLCRPADVGADVCHVNLHKTFCIPHGGGGPGMGPIGVAQHLAKFLPRHPVVAVGGDQGLGPIERGPLGQREHPAHLVGVRRDDGTRGPQARQRSGHPQRELRRRSAPRVVPGGLPRQARTGRARVHPGHPRRQALGRRRGGRHREAPHGLRLPRAHDELSHRRNADGRADRERSPRRARSLLRGDDRYPRRDPRRRRGRHAPRRQPAQARPPHGRGHRRERLETPVHARASCLPRSVDAVAQVLAGGRTHQQRPRRSKPHLYLRPDRAVIPSGRPDLAAISCAAVACAACSVGKSLVPPPDASADTAQEVLGPAGGALSTPDGVLTLRVPSGAVDHDVLFTVGPAAPPLSAAVGGAYEIGPAGTQFAAPATVSIRYTPADLDGAPSSDLLVATVAAGQWQPLASGAVDARAGVVSGATSHLSPFALVHASSVVTPDAGTCATDEAPAGTCAAPVRPLCSGAAGTVLYSCSNASGGGYSALCCPPADASAPVDAGSPRDATVDADVSPDARDGDAAFACTTEVMQSGTCASSALSLCSDLADTVGVSCVDDPVGSGFTVVCCARDGGEGG